MIFPRYSASVPSGEPSSRAALILLCHLVQWPSGQVLKSHYSVPQLLFEIVQFDFTFHYLIEFAQENLPCLLIQRVQKHPIVPMKGVLFPHFITQEHHPHARVCFMDQRSWVGFMIPIGKLPTPALRSSLQTASGSPPRSSSASASYSSSAQVVPLCVGGRSLPQIITALAHTASPTLLSQSESASDLAPRVLIYIYTNVSGQNNFGDVSMGIESSCLLLLLLELPLESTLPSKRSATGLAGNKEGLGVDQM